MPEAVAAPVAASAATTPRRARARNVVHPLTRAQEYAFIKADLRRLLITAAIVTVVMLVLLFVLD
jgi:hypothetical protein